jgi:ATP-dependent Clp protease protease subunit
MAKKQTTMTPDFRMESKPDGAAELFIYDQIGPGWLGMIDGVVVAAAMKKIDASAPLSVYINSPGGSVFEGVAIYNLLSRHKGEVTVHIDGAALSVASIIAMAGDTVKIAENAMFMIHDPWSIAIGNAGELRDTAAVLEKMAGSLASTYVSRTNKDPDEVRQMMADETWFDASEAVEHGFADEVVSGKHQAVAASLKFQPKNMPQKFAAMVRIIPDQITQGIDDSPACAEPPKASNPGVMKMTLEQFNAFAANNPDATAGFINQGKKVGAAEARTEMKAFLAAFPANPLFAAEQFAAGRTLDEAKATDAEIAKATAVKDAEIKAQADEIARLKAEAGTQGAVATGATTNDNDTDPSTIDDPKARATAEWKANIEDCNSKFSSEQRYVASRTAEITGKLRVK